MVWKLSLNQPAGLQTETQRGCLRIHKGPAAVAEQNAGRDFIGSIIHSGHSLAVLGSWEDTLRNPGRRYLALKKSVEGDLGEDWRCHKILDFLGLTLSCSLFGKKRLKTHLFSLEMRNAPLFLCLFLLL